MRIEDLLKCDRTDRVCEKFSYHFPCDLLWYRPNFPKMPSKILSVSLRKATWRVMNVHIPENQEISSPLFFMCCYCCFFFIIKKSLISFFSGDFERFFSSFFLHFVSSLGCWLSAACSGFSFRSYTHFVCTGTRSWLDMCGARGLSSSSLGLIKKKTQQW